MPESRARGPGGHLPELARLREALARDPGDLGACLELARGLLRRGERAGSYAALDAFLDRQDAPEVEALQAEVLSSGRLREALEPVALASPDTGKPRTRHAVTALAIDPAETRLAVAKGSGDLWVVPLGGGEPSYLGKTAKNKGARALAWAPDGSAFFSGGPDGYLRRWDPEAGSGARASKKLPGIVESLVAWRGQLLAADLTARYTVGGDGEVASAPSTTRWVCRVGGAALEARVREGLGRDPAAVPDDNAALARYWDEALRTDLQGRAVALLREGVLRLARGEAWETLEDPRLVLRRVLDLAPLGRALAIGESIRVVQQHPLDPGSRGLRVCLLEGGLRVLDLLEETFVSAVAFSPSGGLLAVGCRTGALSRVPMLEDERPPEPEEAATSERPPAWETRGTPAMKLRELRRLGSYGEGGGGFRGLAGAQPGMGDDVVLLGRPNSQGGWALEPTCLALKDGSFRPTAEAWGGRGFPRQPAERGRTTPAWARPAGRPARAWVLDPEGRVGALLVRGEPAVVWVLPISGEGRGARFEAGGPVAQVAFSPRGRRLVVLRKDGAVEVYGSG